MKIVTKRIVSLLVSLFLLVSSMSVCFTAFAVEETSLEPLAIETIMKTGSLKDITQTTVDAENNYSIPEKLRNDDSNFRPRHVYYHQNNPLDNGDKINNVDTNMLWDNDTGSGNVDFKIIKSSDHYTNVFYDFGDVYEINEVRWGNYNNDASMRASDITFYAGNDYVTLYSEENKIGYLKDAVNAATIKTTGLKARYVAAKVEKLYQEECKEDNKNYLRVTEFNVLGKHYEKAQIGTTTVHTSYNTAGAAVDGLTSLVDDNVGSLSIYTKINDTINEDTNDYGTTLSDGELDAANSTAVQATIAQAESNKYVEGEKVYSSLTYDLGEVKNVTDVLVAYGMCNPKTGSYDNTGKYLVPFYNVYVSEDKEINETDLVAQVNDLGTRQYYKYDYAHTVNLGDGKAGQYVEIRIYVAIRGVGGADTSYWKWSLSEFNVYGNDYCSHTKVIDAAVAPTCTATGLTEGKHCSKCNAVFVAQEEVAALGHDVIIVGKIDPTETTPGYTGDEVCQRCDTTLQVGSQIPMVIDFMNCVSLEGQINCKNNDIKVLFQIPYGKSDIRGMQLSFNIPQGFTLEEVSTPLTGWSIASSLTGFVILTCDNNMATLEEVAQPNEFNKYHVLTLKLIPDQSVATGQKQTTVTVEDVTTGYDSNINSTPTNITFDYVKGHTAGEAVVENEVAADCLNNGSYNNVVYCTTCNAELSRDTITVDALGHNWQINTEDEVKYCANNNCDVKDIPVYIVKFYGRSERLLYETAVEIGEGGVGYLSDADIVAANAAAPCIYGYNHIGWNIELTTKTPITASRLIFAVYERKTERYNTILEDSEGKTIDTKEIEFDQRFVVESDTAKSFLVEYRADTNDVIDQIVGGEEGVVLYGLGSELVVKTSQNVAPKEISVAILKAEAELINDKYVYRVFVHVYNPLDAEISQIGVIFAPESVYTNDENFKIETLNKDKCKILSTELETSDVLATFTGIKRGVTRIVRGYAVSNGTNTYSKVVVKHKFN